MRAGAGHLAIRHFSRGSETGWWVSTWAIMPTGPSAWSLIVRPSSRTREGAPFSRSRFSHRRSAEPAKTSLSTEVGEKPIRREILMILIRGGEREEATSLFPYYVCSHRTPLTPAYQDHQVQAAERSMSATAFHAGPRLARSVHQLRQLPLAPLLCLPMPREKSGYPGRHSPSPVGRSGVFGIQPPTRHEPA